MSEAAKAQKQGVEIFPHPDAGKTRDKVAAAVGLGSGRTYETAKKVWEAAKNGEEAALQSSQSDNSASLKGKSLPQSEGGSSTAQNLVPVALTNKWSQ